MELCFVVGLVVLGMFMYFSEYGVEVFGMDVVVLEMGVVCVVWFGKVELLFLLW